MARLIGIVGRIGSGKDTIANHLISDYAFKKDSFASSVKDACSMLFGWPRALMEGDTSVSREWRDVPDTWWSQKLGIDNFTPRLAMQHLANDLFRDHFHSDFWMMTLQRRLNQSHHHSHVISDVRYPNEAKFIKDNGGDLIRVTRGEDPEWLGTAVSANFGDGVSISVMSTTYQHVPESEWRSAGIHVDHTIQNDGDVGQLLARVGQYMGCKR